MASIVVLAGVCWLSSSSSVTLPAGGRASRWARGQSAATKAGLWAANTAQRASTVTSH